MSKKLFWKTEKRKVKDLVRCDKNPNVNTERQFSNLKKSIKRDGYVEIIVIDTDGTIVAGAHRHKALMEMGMAESEIEVRVPNRKLTQEEFDRYLIASNALHGEWNLDSLAEFEESFLADIGLSEEELDNIFGLDIEDDFNIEKAMDKAVKNPKGIQKGDLWQLGEHKLLIGDCTDRKNWERLMLDEKFDFLFSDPPYRISYSTKRVRKVKTAAGSRLKRSRSYIEVGETNAEGKSKTGFGYKQNRFYDGVESHGGVPEFDEWLSIANSFQNPVGANVMIFENWKNTVELWQAMEKYWKIRNQVIWWTQNRCQGFSSKHKFFNKYDICLLADKGRSVKEEEYEKELDDYLKEKGQKFLDSYEVILYGQTRKSYWDKKKGTRWATVSDHITSPVETGKSSGQNIVFGTKPVSILTPFVKILCPRNGIVMEPFTGSGSTIISCEIMKRKCRAIELSPLYGEVIISRWEKFTGLKAKKL